MSNTVIINLFIYKAYKYCYVDEKFHIEVSLSHENEICVWPGYLRFMLELLCVCTRIGVSLLVGVRTL